jgi:hypothetical protein
LLRADERKRGTRKGVYLLFRPNSGVGFESEKKMAEKKMVFGPVYSDNYFSP